MSREPHLAPSPIARLRRQVTTAVASAVAMAVAAALTLVAFAYALYAGLLTWLAPAGASAATAATFAVICGLLAFLTPQLLSSKPKAPQSSPKPKISSATVGLGLELGLTLVGALFEMSRHRRANARIKHHRR